MGRKILHELPEAPKIHAPKILANRVVLPVPLPAENIKIKLSPVAISLIHSSCLPVGSKKYKGFWSTHLVSCSCINKFSRSWFWDGYTPAFGFSN